MRTKCSVNNIAKPGNKFSNHYTLTFSERTVKIFLFWRGKILIFAEYKLCIFKNRVFRHVSIFRLD